MYKRYKIETSFAISKWVAVVKLGGRRKQQKGRETLKLRRYINVEHWMRGKEKLTNWHIFSKFIGVTFYVSEASTILFCFVSSLPSYRV
jgi:hypothetical protein